MEKFAPFNFSKEELIEYTPEWKGERFEDGRSEEHTSELQSLANRVCRLLLEKKNV